MSSSTETVEAGAASTANEPEHRWFSDDEPLPDGNVIAEKIFIMKAKGLPKASVEATPESPVVLCSLSRSAFPVLVKVRAPPMSEYHHPLQRAPVDLVIVVDTSSSTRGPKLVELKRAVEFAIDSLSPLDRLSIVSLSCFPQRVLPLRIMTERGRSDAKQAVSSLVAEGGTNIVGGLQKGAQVLEERLHQNSVACIIVLSGQWDNCYCAVQPRSALARSRRTPEYLELLPPSIYPGNLRMNDGFMQCTFPVYTIGFGPYHDAIGLHTVADASGGTYSFVDSYDLLKDAVASCIGGLLSIVVQDLNLLFETASPNVEIKAITSGRHQHSISVERTKAKLNIADIFAGEEKQFLITLMLPELLVVGQESKRDTLLLEITCCYKDAVARESMQIKHSQVIVHRPRYINPAYDLQNKDHKRQWTRLNVEETIAKTLQLAEEEGDLSHAHEFLSTRVSHFMGTEQMAGDDTMAWLLGELLEIEGRIKSQRAFEMKGGRAYALSSLSLHAYQRATTRGDRVPGEEAISEVSNFELYSTLNMANMVTKSRSTLA